MSTDWRPSDAPSRSRRLSTYIPLQNDLLNLFIAESLQRWIIKSIKGGNFLLLNDFLPSCTLGRRAVRAVGTGADAQGLEPPRRRRSPGRGQWLRLAGRAVGRRLRFAAARTNGGARFGSGPRAAHTGCGGARRHRGAGTAQAPRCRHGARVQGAPGFGPGSGPHPQVARARSTAASSSCGSAPGAGCRRVECHPLPPSHRTMQGVEVVAPPDARGRATRPPARKCPAQRRWTSVLTSQVSCVGRRRSSSLTSRDDRGLRRPPAATSGPDARTMASAMSASAVWASAVWAPGLGGGLGRRHGNAAARPAARDAVGPVLRLPERTGCTRRAARAGVAGLAEPGRAASPNRRAGRGAGQNEPSLVPRVLAQRPPSGTAAEPCARIPGAHAVRVSVHRIRRRRGPGREVCGGRPEASHRRRRRAGLSAVHLEVRDAHGRHPERRSTARLDWSVSEKLTHRQLENKTL